MGRDETQRVRAFLDPNSKDAGIFTVWSNNLAFDHELFPVNGCFLSGYLLRSPMFAQCMGELLQFIQSEATIEKKRALDRPFSCSRLSR